MDDADTTEFHGGAADERRLLEYAAGLPRDAVAIERNRAALAASGCDCIPIGPACSHVVAERDARRFAECMAVFADCFRPLVRS